jgi:IS30 family transposase
MSYMLTSKRRFSPELLLLAELNGRDVARFLGRHHKTISRKIRRNVSSGRRFLPGRLSAPGSATGRQTWCWDQ